MTEKTRTQAEMAPDLAKALDRALERFAGEHTELVRGACAVPPEVLDLTWVVTCTFLGHTVERLRRARGRAHVEAVVCTLLDQLDGMDVALETFERKLAVMRERHAAALAKEQAQDRAENGPEPSFHGEHVD